MAAYRQVYDLRHLQADYQELVISSGTLLSVIEYGLPLPFFTYGRGSFLWWHCNVLCTTEIRS